MWDEIAPDQSAISVMHIGAFNNCTLTDQETVHLKFCITLYWSVLITETQNRSISSFCGRAPHAPSSSRNRVRYVSRVPRCLLTGTVQPL